MHRVAWILNFLVYDLKLSTCSIVLYGTLSCLCTIHIPKMHRGTFKRRNRDAYPRDIVILMVWSYFRIILALKFLILHNTGGSWTHSLLSSRGLTMKYTGLSNELDNFEGKKNACIDSAQLSRFGSCPSNLITMVCMLLFPQPLN